ncbi:MAG TPA: hypothetical protein VMS17_33890 [Gemmataceae bacterium]|nr:hypothetical protein [Gemmataceae bacterium]
MVNVLIGVSEARRQALLRVGFPVPAPFAVHAVLDTGSFISLADSQGVGRLGVGPYRQRQFFTSATGPTPHIGDVYGCPAGRRRYVIGILAARRRSPGRISLPRDVIHGVIGRARKKRSLEL